MFNKDHMEDITQAKQGHVGCLGHCLAKM